MMQNIFRNPIIRERIVRNFSNDEILRFMAASNELFTPEVAQQIQNTFSNAAFWENIRINSYSDIVDQLEVLIAIIMQNGNGIRSLKMSRCGQLRIADFRRLIGPIGNVEFLQLDDFPARIFSSVIETQSRKNKKSLKK